MALVEVRNASKSFGRTSIMQDISITAQDGEFLVLVGPSGCGKTTLLRIIAGLEDISRGDVLIDHAPVTNLAPRERDVAMVFQGYALYPRMTVRENLSFGLKIRGASKAQIAAKVSEVADILGLAAYLDRMPKQLSGGQRQRVAMGRAIVRNPKVFLFDEPLSNLDAKLRVQMRAELKRLHTRIGATSIYVTHDQIEAMTMADRVVVMRDGHIEQSGPPLEIFDRPATLFVASFIGSPAMNLLPGRLQRDAGRLKVELGEGLAVPLDDRFDGRSGQDVVLGIRPEHFELAGGPSGIPAVVELVEPTGTESIVSARFGGKPLTFTTRERHGFKPGDRIHLAAIPGTAHLFDNGNDEDIAQRHAIGFDRAVRTRTDLRKPGERRATRP